jgi:acetyl-CoA carboxylase biotin carboxylase subunit
MGDKARARRVADKVGVPTIPGDSRGFLDPSEALAVAEKAGYPILLKACAGGGGRGMKIVKSSEELVSTFQMAQREVEAAFGDGHLLVEKYLPRVRHIEVQIAGDQSHNIVHLGIRDCSIQRRYQKVLEEAPSIGLPADMQNQIQDAAVELGKSVNYSSLGTVEFLADLENQKFYFIEMNTRLQVEHPVTEMVTDMDLVKEQIMIAAGQDLSVQQKDVKLVGHAIEARINAEDPRTLIPSPGLIKSYHPPGGNGVRVDSAVYAGYSVKPYYDSMISKLIVRDKDRESCIKKLLVALDEYLIDGISTNIELHRRILNHPDFRSGNFSTKFLEQVQLFG